MSRMKALAKILLILAVILIIAAVGANIWYQSAISTPANAGSTEKKVFEVEQGDSSSEIVKKLVDQGFVSQELPLTVYLRLNPDLVQGFKAGLFEISQAMTPVEIIAELQKSSRGDELKVTIPEGLRYDEIADILTEEFGKVDGSRFSRDAFMGIVEAPDSVGFSNQVIDFLNEHKPSGKNLEGYLYPETYFFSTDADAKEVVERLLSTLQSQLKEADFTAIEDSGYSFFEILNIAAMIERESFADSEKADVADVFYKRLEQGVDGVKLLQVDATLLYIAKDWKANAFSLKTSDDPYNTYKYPGLPPGPIANAGITSIKAAIYPRSNPYFYYIHDNSGKIHFAKDLAEHNANVRQYL
jgi:UPF0755 protein